MRWSTRWAPSCAGPRRFLLIPPQPFHVLGVCSFQTLPAPLRAASFGLVGYPARALFACAGLTSRIGGQTRANSAVVSSRSCMHDPSCRNVVREGQLTKPGLEAGKLGSRLWCWKPGRWEPGGPKSRGLEPGPESVSVAQSTRSLEWIAQWRVLPARRIASSGLEPGTEKRLGQLQPAARTGEEAGMLLQLRLLRQLALWRSEPPRQWLVPGPGRPRLAERPRSGLARQGPRPAR